MLSKTFLYITIASVDSDGNPWNSPVFSAHDSEYNFYWGSHKGSQHSKNIAENQNVFLVIYDSTIPAGEGEGVYIKAEAIQIPVTKELYELLRTRHQPADFWEYEQLSAEAPISLYKAIPKQILGQ